MIIGFCGSGSMAAAMARGLKDAVPRMLFTDSGSGRAAELAAEVGGEAVSTNSELAERADAVVLAVKPAKLDDIATELAGAGVVVSLLGATPLATVKAAFPDADVLRVMPNVAVEVRRGVLCVASDVPSISHPYGGTTHGTSVRDLLSMLGHVIELDDSEFDAATAVMGCAPAYLALAVEAIADAGAADGLDAELARELVVETTAGTAELLGIRHPADVRRAVASPGGSTEAGLEALDRHGVRRAFEAAVQASLERMRGG